MSDRNEFISAIDLAAKHGSEIAICIDASFKRLPIEQGCIQDLWEQRLESLINELRQHGAYVYTIDSGKGESVMAEAPSTKFPNFVVRIPAPTIDDLVIRPMDLSSEQDIDAYVQLVAPSMSDDDYIAPQELRDGLHGRPLFSWFAEIYGQVVGWSCIGMPSRYIVESDSVHLMGVVTDPGCRSFGIARRLTEHRLALCGTRPLSVSIRPGNIESENLLRSFGFEPLGSAHVWQNWYRNATPKNIVKEA